ncbi:RICIN domain-containing protein [Rubritalea profundi]|uniref:Ricin B lectin domain-containing protein n=1 Tax=Rubritalea profundi TaxID=1658618 RepID=A0A2S7U336_9BACT|nr:RICIN domain-containing protein [Rubritalea profundi]PQJ29406.1 hypothetical protein BSZ32_13525 [Rubritalea profundi]
MKAYPNTSPKKQISSSSQNSLRLLLIGATLSLLLSSFAHAQKFTPRTILRAEFKSSPPPNENVDVGAVYLIKVKASEADNATVHGGGMFATVHRDGKGNSARIYQLQGQDEIVSGGRHQQWIFFRTPDLPKSINGKPHYSYYIIGRSSGLFATVESASTDDAEIYLWQKDDNVNSDHQKFYFVEDKDAPGSYTIRNKNSDAFWTRDGDRFENTGNIVQGSATGNRWEFLKAKESEFPAAPEPELEQKLLASWDPLKIEWKQGKPIFDSPTEAFHAEFRYINAVLVDDPTMSLSEKIDSSPYYRIVKESYAVMLGSNDNSDSDGESPAKFSVSFTEGLSKTDMKSFTESFSFTFGTGEKSPVNFQATYGFAFTQEESKTLSTGKQITQEIDLAPFSAGAVYGVEYRYKLERLDGTLIREWTAGAKPKFKTVTSKKRGTN